MASNPAPVQVCDYLHDEPRAAAWVYIGESGDYYVCDEHFQMRPEGARQHWRPIDPAATGEPKP